MERSIYWILEKLCLLVTIAILFYILIALPVIMNSPEYALHFQLAGLIALTLAILYVGLQIQKLADKIGKE